PRGRLRGQGEGGEDGASPCSEILRREVVAPDLPQVRIDVGRVYRLAIALLVQVLEELVSGQLLTLPDHAGEPAVRDADRMMLATLAPELEAQPRSLDGDVLAPQGREPIGPVVACVLLVAHPDQRRLEQAHHRGEDLLSRQAGPGQVSLDVLADLRERLGKIEESGVLRLIPYLAPARMVAILLAASGVPSHRLHMPMGNRADPHVGPSGRNGKLANAAKCDQVTDRGSLRSDIAESGSVTHPPEPGLGVGDVSELSGAGCLSGVDGGHGQAWAGAHPRRAGHGRPPHGRGNEQSACQLLLPLKRRAATTPQTMAILGIVIKLRGPHHARISFEAAP